MSKTYLGGGGGLGGSEKNRGTVNNLTLGQVREILQVDALVLLFMVIFTCIVKKIGMQILYEE